MNNTKFVSLFLGLVLTLLTFEAKAGYDYTWNGSVSSNWNTNGNWSNGGGFYASGVHRINSSGSSPVISANPARNITAIDLFSTGQLSINGGNTTVDGLFNVRGNGDVFVSNGSLTINENLFVYDNGSRVNVSGGTVNVTQNISLGERQANNDATNG